MLSRFCQDIRYAPSMKSFPPFQLENADGQIKDAGARLVVVTQQSSTRATAWRDELTLAVRSSSPTRNGRRTAPSAHGGLPRPGCSGTAS